MREGKDSAEERAAAVLVLCVVWEKVAARPGVGSVQSMREGYNGLIRRGGSTIYLQHRRIRNQQLCICTLYRSESLRARQSFKSPVQCSS